MGFVRKQQATKTNNKDNDRINKLTNKQRRFVEEYLVDLNATQAAIRAGYSVNNAGDIGSELLRKTRVSQAVKEAMAKQSKRTGVSADRVIRELAKIAFLNSADFITENGKLKEGVSRDDMAAVSSIKIKEIPTASGLVVEREVKLYDKLRAMELLGKHLAMFSEKLNVNMDVNLADVLKKAWEGKDSG